MSEDTQYVNISGLPKSLVKRLKVEAILADYKGVGEYLRALLIEHFENKDKEASNSSR